MTRVLQQDGGMESHLTEALSRTDDPEVRFHLRHALQLLETDQ